MAAVVMPRRVGERVDLEVGHVGESRGNKRCVATYPPDSSFGIDNQKLLAEREVLATTASSSDFH